MLRKNTAGQFVHIAAVSVTTGLTVTGATWTMRRCLDGTFAAGGATITEDGTTGWSKVALAQADTNANNLGFFFTAASCVPVTINVVTTAGDPTDSVRFGLTALPNAAAGSTNGLPVVDATGGVKLQAAQKVDVDTIKTNAVVNAGTITFPTTATLASTTNITAGTVTTATNLTNAPTVGDFTATMKTSLNAATPASVTGAVGSVTGAVGSVTARVTANTDQLAGSATAVTNLSSSAQVIYPGTVTGATTTTTLIDSGLTQADTDFWKGRIVIFLTGTLKFQATDITAFTPATDQLTFTALTAAPSGGDTYVVL